MNSPIEPHAPLVAVELEQGLNAWRDPVSGGVYLKAADYWEWLAHQPGRLETLPPRGTHSPNTEDPECPARICPETGALMTRFRVGHGFTFLIDRSPTGGFWLDAGEWEALKAQSLHDEVHRVFTSSWQKTVRTEARQDALERLLRAQIGTEDYDRAAAFRDWLAQHPHRTRVLAWVSEPLTQG